MRECEEKARECEEKAQECVLSRASQLDLATGSGLASRQSWHTCEACTEAKVSRQLLHFRTNLPV